MWGKMSMKKILTISAHPDDVEYYSGGTLLKMAKSHEITSLVVTDGSLNGLSKTRINEQMTVSKRIGVKQNIFLHYPDLGIEENKKELHIDLLNTFLSIRPDIVFSFDTENQFHVHDDFHPDHRVLSILVIDQIYLYLTLPSYLKKMGIHKKPLIKKPELWLFDPYKSNYYEDISSYWNNKKEVTKNF